MSLGVNEVCRTPQYSIVGVVPLYWRADLRRSTPQHTRHACADKHNRCKKQCYHDKGNLNVFQTRENDNIIVIVEVEEVTREVILRPNIRNTYFITSSGRS